jgi:hypothetical protein
MRNRGTRFYRAGAIGIVFAAAVAAAPATAHPPKAAGASSPVTMAKTGGKAMISDSNDARAARSAGSTPVKNRVTFPGEGGVPLIGNLYLPESYKPGDRLPGVVVAGTWTSVKEQMAERYAKRMAERGYAALSFDFRNYGESGGEPRQYESARLKSEDIQSAARFLRSRPEVDPERIGGLAVCASASYMALSLAGGVPIKSFVTVSAWLHDPETVGQAYGGEAGVRERLERADAARKKYEATKEVEYVPAQSAADKTAAMPFPIDFYENPGRGKLPQWTNRFAVMGWRDWLTIDPISPAPRSRSRP